MDLPNKELSKSLILSRSQNPSWLLLASRKGPLVISCLKSLFELSHDGIPFEDAEQHLIEILTQHSNDNSFGIQSSDIDADARKELRNWIKKKLIVEREGKIMGTDALQQVFQFVDGLDERIMTSTASRLSTVQREIENLEVQLNPDPDSRVLHIKNKIKELEKELAKAQGGDIEILEGTRAVEGIREVFSLAMSLRSDFRRVEDSYREADKKLRQSIISDQQNRGQVVDSLLDGHEELLETPEGQVFHSFHEQLTKSTELDIMKKCIKSILQAPFVKQALNKKQQNELRWLVIQLTKESSNVIRARSQSEKDVKNFLKTGIAKEHHRVSQLLNEILDASIKINWDSPSIRRSEAPLPPIAVSLGHSPLIERLHFYNDDKDSDEEQLMLNDQSVNLNEIDDDFWEAFDTLDHDQLIEDTLKLLSENDKTMTISELAEHLPPTHDLETIVVWLLMAREADLRLEEDRIDVFQVTDKENQKILFKAPTVEMEKEKLNLVNRENL